MSRLAPIPPFREVAENFKNASIPYREMLLTLKASELNKTDPPQLAFLIRAAQALKFFPDPIVLEKFREAGFSKYFLAWFIPLDAIEEEFRRIQCSGVLIPFKHFALECIGTHLDSKIWHQGLMEATGACVDSDGTTVSNIGNQMRNFVRKIRRAFRSGKPFNPKTKLDSLLYQQFQYATSLSNAEQAYKYYLKLSNGKTECFLNELARSYMFKLEAVSQTKFTSDLYDLLLLICPDWPAPRTKSDWNKIDTVQSIPAFKASRVMDFIFKKSAEMKYGPDLP
jgi:hypothetical protein